MLVDIHQLVEETESPEHETVIPKASGTGAAPAVPQVFQHNKVLNLLISVVLIANQSSLGGGNKGSPHIGWS